MALDPQDGENGGFLYFTDAQGGTISRIELLTADDGSRNDRSGRVEVIVSGLTDPMGVALELDKKRRLFYTLRSGSIRAVARNGIDYVGGNLYVLRMGGIEEPLSDYEVRRLDSGTRLDGIAIAESKGTGDDPTELRLHWSEHGRAASLKRSTLDGTRVEEVMVLSSAGVHLMELYHGQGRSRDERCDRRF